MLERIFRARRAWIVAAEGFHRPLAVRYGGGLANDEEDSRVADDDGHAGQ